MTMPNYWAAIGPVAAGSSPKRSELPIGTNAVSDCPICALEYPNLRRARNRPVPFDLRAVLRA
jgi:hypothetical protein